LIVLFTDFGLTGPYVGQVKAALIQEAPGVPIVDLMHDAPTFHPKAAAYLLAAFIDEFPPDSLFLCVVDPGVGTESRLPISLTVDRRRFVGPNNGLFSVVARRARQVQATEITWRPHRLSASFHGRDLFAPVAAMLARGESVIGRPLAVESVIMPSWPQELAQVIYIDHFGNAMTGLRAEGLHTSQRIVMPTNMDHQPHTAPATDTVLHYARTFGEVPAGRGFWYENANGLVEIAVNQGNAARQFGLQVGSPVTGLPPVGLSNSQ